MSGALLLTLAQVMISPFVILSPPLGSALTVWSLLGILSPVSVPPLVVCAHCAFSLSLNEIKKKKKDTCYYFKKTCFKLLKQKFGVSCVINFKLTKQILCCTQDDV